MIVKKEEIYSWDSEYRLKFTNSLSGYKGVHLIGTKGKGGVSHLAISDSIIHISSDPARIGFIMKPLAVPIDTYNNIVEMDYYTINHVHKSFLDKAHFTSAKLTSNETAFDFCNLGEEYTEDFPAPFVAESTIKIGLKLIDDIEIKESQNRLIIGEVQFIDTDESLVEKDGQLNLEKAHDVCITGLNQYSSVKKLTNLPQALKENLPNFNRKKRPDNVVFDEKSQSYNANLLPYGTNIGSPSIITNNLSIWKSRGISSFNHVLKSKIEGIKEEYNSLLEEYKTNELLYNAKYDFEPIIGEVYHLYVRDNTDENFLSMIPPHTWKRKLLGSFKLDSEKVWREVKN